MERKSNQASPASKREGHSKGTLNLGYYSLVGSESKAKGGEEEQKVVLVESRDVCIDDGDFDEVIEENARL